MMGLSLSASYLVEPSAGLPASERPAAQSCKGLARRKRRRANKVLASPAHAAAGDEAPWSGSSLAAPPATSSQDHDDADADADDPIASTVARGAPMLALSHARTASAINVIGSDEPRSSCSDESALVRPAQQQDAASARRKQQQPQPQPQPQRTRKRRLQQQRTRKQRLQQQIEASKAASAGKRSEQKNKDSASNATPPTSASKHQPLGQQIIVSGSHEVQPNIVFAQISPELPLGPDAQPASAKSDTTSPVSAVTVNDHSEFAGIHENATRRQAISPGESSNNNNNDDNSLIAISSEASLASVSAEQGKLNNNNNNNSINIISSEHKAYNKSATSDQKLQQQQQQQLQQQQQIQHTRFYYLNGSQQISASTGKQNYSNKPTIDQLLEEPSTMSIGDNISGSNRSKRRNIKSSKFSQQLEIQTPAAHWKRSTSSQISSRRLEPQTTPAASCCSTQNALKAPYSCSPAPDDLASDCPSAGAALINRLIIPAANLSLYLNASNPHLSQHQIQFSPNYVEQQLESNCCCCWERDPNNRDYCKDQLNNVAHCHDVPQPPRRPWIEKRSFVKGQQQRTRDNFYTIVDDSSDREFSVLSYNVLCDRMAKPQYFSSTPYSALIWTYRRAKILDQLRDYNADIVALQELEWEQFDSFFKPRLAALNYDGLFEPKSRYKTMDSVDMIRRVDGCAIFYKHNKFKLVQKHLLEFRRIAVANANGNQPMINRVQTKDNIGLVAILELLPSPAEQFMNQRQPTNRKKSQKEMIDESIGRHVLVCNTHIHWNPDDCDVKLIQTIMLMDELSSIARQHKATFTSKNTTTTSANSSKFPQVGGPEDTMPLILLGDFNSMPDSGVTDYLINGEISSLHADFKDYRYSAIGSGINQLLRRQSSPAWCNYSTPMNSLSSPNTSPPATPIITKISASSSLSDDSSILTTQSSSSSKKHFTLNPSLPFATLSPVNTLVDSTDLLSSSPSTSTSSVDSACYSTSSSPVPVLNYSHPFKLTSAYEKNLVPFTNYTQQFKAIIDYIFYSNESLQLLGLLGPLDNNWLRANRIRTLPQPHVPSDHLPLLVKFRLNKATATKEDDERHVASGDSIELPNRQRPHRQQQQVLSKRYNGTLHVSGLGRRLESGTYSASTPMPVDGDKMIHTNLKIHQQRAAKCKWGSNPHSRLTRTTSQPTSNKDNLK